MDMNLILAYHNFIDDWKDEHSYAKKAFVKISFFFIFIVLSD